MSDFDLNDHVFRLLQSEPFFAALSRRIDKRVGPVPTAGVTVTKDGHFEMVYNPEFFAGLTDEQRTGVLVHEFYHLIFEHVTGRLPDELAGVMHGENQTPERVRMFRLWNIATDLSINYHIGADKLPEGCCIPGGQQFEDLQGNMSAEWYYDQLKQKLEDQENDSNSDDDGDSDSSGSGSGSDSDNNKFDPDNCGQFDDHGQWGEGGELTPENQAAMDIAKERLKDALKDAAQEASDRGWGSVSQSCRKEIMERLTSKVDWRKVLRYFVKTSQRADKRSTPRRLNKRFPRIHAGKRVRRQAKIAISIDQSGSVDDRMLTAFFSELNKLAEIAEFTVVPFDTEVAVDKVYTWKKGQSKKTERVLTGGTCFNAPTKYVNEQGFDGHIILTDLCAPKPIASKCQRMWMTTKAHAARPYFQTNERIIAIDD